MPSPPSRREFIQKSAVLTGAAAALQASRAAAAETERKGLAEYPRDRPTPGGPVGSDTDRGKLVPGRRNPDDEPVPITASDLERLPWKMVDGAKEFHLVAQHLKREFLPGMWFDVWGYNGSMPGPTIEVVEGDRVRIIVHNKLPEATVVHWHGLELPNRFDGVAGVTQDAIPPGGTFTYEFDLHQNGTFFYHSHGPMQEGLGMVGLFIIHPKQTYQPAVDRDFALILQEWAILPMSTVPNTMSMEFNFFTINGRSGPYTTPLVCRLGDRVRIRFVNFSSIDQHPMHLHGHTFWVTGTEGGRIPESAWVPGNNVIVGVAQVREVEFIANNPGDWVMHCHMFHHMMNHMTSMVGPPRMHGEMNMQMSANRRSRNLRSVSRFEMPAGGDMSNSLGMIIEGPALDEAHGPHLGRGLGEQTGNEREVRNGVQPGKFVQHDQHQHESPDHPSGGQHEGHAGQRPGEMPDPTPGFPQDMLGMNMLMPPQIKKVNKPETRGMRNDWFTGVEALMTVVRVLPDELYEKVMSGEGELKPGESVPGGTPGKDHMKGAHSHG